MSRKENGMLNMSGSDSAQVESIGYDIYKVTATYQGAEAVGMAAFARGTDVSTQYGQDALRHCVARQARAKFGGDVDYQVTVEKGSAPFGLPAGFCVTPLIEDR